MLIKIIPWWHSCSVLDCCGCINIVTAKKYLYTSIRHQVPVVQALFSLEIDDVGCHRCEKLAKINTTIEIEFAYTIQSCILLTLVLISSLAVCAMGKLINHSIVPMSTLIKEKWPRLEASVIESSKSIGIC